MKINATTTAVEYNGRLILLASISLIMLSKHHDSILFYEIGHEDDPIKLIINDEDAAVAAYNNLMDRLGFKMD